MGCFQVTRFKVMHKVLLTDRKSQTAVQKKKSNIFKHYYYYTDQYIIIIIINVFITFNLNLVILNLFSPKSLCFLC